MKITITGPRSIGKTTISKLVAKKLGLEYISTDEIGEEVFKKHGGLDKAMKSGIVEESIKKGGYGRITNIYETKDNFVFDLSGGSFSSDKLPEATEKVRNCAKKHSIIVGLLPSENSEESIKLLFEREKERPHFKEMDKKELMEKTIRSFNRFPPLFEKFCNLVIYTKGKTPDKIANEIVKSLAGK
ncbi:hypothetical protein FJZ21_03770 [Candidatus Pacearchaeota archaeon]|nr:hypothetical protein [Candidatus Pacearchaeota archaeon]